MRWRRNLRNNPSGEERKRPFRRPGWGGLFLLLLPVLWIAFALGQAVFLETDRLLPVRKSVVLPGLPDAFDGFRIAVMSDFHLTTGSRDRSLLQRAVELSNALQPDAVFLLGDFVEGNIPGYKGEVNRNVSKTDPAHHDPLPIGRRPFAVGRGTSLPGKPAAGLT